MGTNGNTNGSFRPRNAGNGGRDAVPVRREPSSAPPRRSAPERGGYPPIVTRDGFNARQASAAQGGFFDDFDDFDDFNHFDDSDNFSNGRSSNRGSTGNTARGGGFDGFEDEGAASSGGADDDGFGDPLSGVASQPQPETVIQKRGMLIALIAILIFSVGLLIFVFTNNTDDNNEYDENRFDPVSQSSVSSDPVEQTASQEDDVSSEDEPVSSEEAVTYQPLKKGDKNDDVKKMQTRLCELGYLDKSSITGYYGDFTAKKVKLFQKKAKLEETGTADEETLRRLYADDAPRASS